MADPKRYFLRPSSAGERRMAMIYSSDVALEMSGRYDFLHAAGDDLVLLTQQICGRDIGVGEVGASATKGTVVC